MSAILKKAQEQEQQRKQQHQQKQEQFKKTVERRQRKTGQGEFGRGGSKDVHAESIAEAEAKVEAERQIRRENRRRGGSLRAGGRRNDGSRVTEATGFIEKVTPKEIEQRKRDIIREKAVEEAERRGPSQKDKGVHERLAERQTQTAQQAKTVIQGTTITGGPEQEPETFRLRRGALTKDQLMFVKQKESEENLKYAGEVGIDSKTGELQFFFISRAAGKQFYQDFMETRATNRRIVEANKQEQARYEREVASIKAEAKDLGYEAVPTKFDQAGNPTEFEYRPLPNQPQYRYEQVDPANPFAGRKKVEIKDPVEVLFGGFREDYKPRDTGVIGQVSEFGRGIKAQAESFAEPFGHKPQDQSALNMLFGIEEPSRGPVTRAEAAELAARTKGEAKTVIDPATGRKVRTDAVAGEPAALITGSPEYQKRQVFGAIGSNPARFIGELYTEGAAAIAGGEVVGAGARGAGAAARGLRGIQRIEIAPPRVAVKTFGTDPLKTGIKTQSAIVKGELQFTAPKVKITKKPGKPAPKQDEFIGDNLSGRQSRIARVDEVLKQEPKPSTELPPAGSVAKEMLKGKPAKTTKPKPAAKPKESRGRKQVTILEEKPKETIGKRMSLPKETQKNLKVKRKIQAEIAKDTAQAGIVTTATVRKKQGAVTVVQEKPSILIEQPKKKSGSPISVVGYPKTFDVPAKEESRPFKIGVRKKRKQELTSSVLEDEVITTTRQTGRQKQDLFTGRRGQVGAGVGGLLEVPQITEKPQRQPERGTSTTPTPTVLVIPEKPITTPVQRPFTTTTTGPGTTPTTDSPPFPPRVDRTYRRPAGAILPGGFGPGGIGLDGFKGQTSVKRVGVRNPLLPGLSSDPESLLKEKKEGLFSALPLFGITDKKGKKRISLF